MVVGGPAFVEWIRPTDEELRKRYNPDLRQRSEEQGDRRAQEFDDYVTKLKEWSKSDKSSMSPISRARCSDADPGWRAVANASFSSLVRGARRARPEAGCH